MPDENMSFETWLHIGMKHKWISDPFCDTHDGMPMTLSEMVAWDKDEDQCFHAVRLFQNPEDFDSWLTITHGSNT